MGYIRHDTILACVPAWARDDGDQALHAFRESLPTEWQPLLTGPVASLTNGDRYWTMHPDGSKEYWPRSDEGDKHRAALIELLEQIECTYACVRWGGDYQSEEGVTAWGN